MFTAWLKLSPHRKTVEEVSSSRGQSTCSACETRRLCKASALRVRAEQAAACRRSLLSSASGSIQCQQICLLPSPQWAQAW